MSLLVAAFDAPAQVRARADYLCDGLADEEEIQTALGQSRSVTLSEGLFILSDSIFVGANGYLGGSGRAATTLRLAPDTHEPLIMNGMSGGDGDVIVSDMTLDGNRDAQTVIDPATGLPRAYHCLQFGQPEGGPLDCLVRDVKAIASRGAGFAFYSAERPQIVRCIAQGHQDGAGYGGLYLANTRYCRVDGGLYSSNRWGIQVANHGLQPGAWGNLIVGAQVQGNTINGISIDDGSECIILGAYLQNNGSLTDASTAHISTYGNSHALWNSTLKGGGIGWKANGGLGLVAGHNVFANGGAGFQLLGGAQMTDFGNVGAGL